ncbi:MAG: hypothetical protein ABIO46_09255 [Chitinophagales bacterium]
MKVLFLLLCSASLLSSCSDKCKKIICYNGAFCLDGNCGCTTGFEGEDCSLEVREKFIGTYNVTDYCSVTGNVMYTVNIGEIDTSVTMVAISNFNNDFSNLVKAIITENFIEIPVQSPDADGRAVSGAGIFSGGGTITWNYTIVSAAGVPNDCTNSVWIK